MSRPGASQVAPHVSLWDAYHTAPSTSHPTVITIDSSPQLNPYWNCLHQDRTQEPLHADHTGGQTTDSTWRLPFQVGLAFAILAELVGSIQVYRSGGLLEAATGDALPVARLQFAPTSRSRAELVIF